MSFRFVMPALIVGSIFHALIAMPASAAQPREVTFGGLEYIYENGVCAVVYDHDEGVCRPCN
jgi:hypothetical protein